MNTQDWIAVITLGLALCGIVYAFGTRDARLSELEKDVNGLGEKLSRNIEEIQKSFKRDDFRIDELGRFWVRVDQRVRVLEEHKLGEAKSARLREMDVHHTTQDEGWYSDNSGIEL
jgi:hypothetical protein